MPMQKLEISKSWKNRRKQNRSISLGLWPWKRTWSIKKTERGRWLKKRHRSARRGKNLLKRNGPFGRTR